eukprot:scaffold202608_cov39-Tisochrysis_lutea.AAC.1
MLLVDNLSERRVALVHPCLALWRRRATRRAGPHAIDALHILLEHPHMDLEMLQRGEGQKTIAFQAKGWARGRAGARGRGGDPATALRRLPPEGL